MCVKCLKEGDMPEFCAPVVRRKKKRLKPQEPVRELPHVRVLFICSSSDAVTAAVGGFITGDGTNLRHIHVRDKLLDDAVLYTPLFLLSDLATTTETAVVIYCDVHSCELVPKLLELLDGVPLVSKVVVVFERPRLVPMPPSDWIGVLSRWWDPQDDTAPSAAMATPSRRFSRKCTYAYAQIHSDPLCGFLVPMLSAHELVSYHNLLSTAPLTKDPALALKLRDFLCSA